MLTCFLLHLRGNIKQVLRIFLVLKNTLEINSRLEVQHKLEVSNSVKHEYVSLLTPPPQSFPLDMNRTYVRIT